MATLKAMPSKAVISMMAGTVDYYLWRGLPCARKWPRWPKRAPYPTEKANQDAFAHAMALTKTLPEFIIDQYKRMVAGTPYRWQDLFVRSYMSGIRY